MRAVEVRDFLKTLDGGWVNWDNTVDTFKIGDPNVEVTGIAVGWMNYTESLKKAHELGCNLFVCHEPLFYDHLDKDERVFEFESVREKRAWLEDAGLVVLRCHDLWDQVKEIGIPDSWGRFLGFENPIDGDGWYRVYDVSGRTALDVARQVASHTKALGQDAVQLLGPADAPVSRVAIGTGAITPYRHYIQTYDADLAICSDDGFSYWRDGALAIDSGVPAIVVNHAVSEIFGIKLLADRLAEAFPETPVHYIPQRCMFRLVGSE